LARQRYKILKKIDAGGMAEIFLARAHSVGGIEKTVAIKRVLPSLTRNTRFVNMFLDDARLSMVLNHANIVQVFDVGRADGTYYIVMEYVEGYNLRRVFQRMNERGFRIPVHYAAFLLAEVCKGLAHAHEQRDPDGNQLGIVHRDISPPNILVSNAGEVKITDFGLAKAVTQLELTDPGIVKGKFSYLSPEAANGKMVDHRADLFAVGILLWEILANRRLFLGKSDMETVELIRKADVPSLSLFNDEVTGELEAIVVKALHRDPRQRWHSARDLGDALARFLFSNNLKVTSYDIAETLRTLFSASGESSTGPAERIGQLIDEEILNLSMMGEIAGGNRADGARPLNDVEVAEGGQHGRLSISDIWKPALIGDLSDRMDLADSLALHVGHAASIETPASSDSKDESSGEKAVSKDKKSGSSKWLIALLILASVGGLAFWLITESGLLEGLF
jgi:serine/threonine protein kinase